MKQGKILELWPVDFEEVVDLTPGVRSESPEDSSSDKESEAQNPRTSITDVAMDLLQTTFGTKTPLYEAVTIIEHVVGGRNKYEIIISNINFEFTRAKLKEVLEFRCKNMVPDRVIVVDKVTISNCVDPNGFIFQAVRRILTDVEEIEVNESSVGKIAPKKQDSFDSELLYFARLKKLTIKNCTELSEIRIRAARLEIFIIDDNSKKSLKIVNIDSILEFEILASNFPSFFNIDDADEKHRYFRMRIGHLKGYISSNNKVYYEKYKERLHLVKDLLFNIKNPLYQEDSRIENIFIVCAHIQAINNFLEHRTKWFNEDKVINLEEQIFDLVKCELELLKAIEAKIIANRQIQLTVEQLYVMELMEHLFTIKSFLFSDKGAPETQNPKRYLYYCFQDIFNLQKDHWKDVLQSQDLQTNIRIDALGNPILQKLNESLEKLKSAVFDFKLPKDLESFVHEIKEIISTISDDLDYFEFMIERGILFLEKPNLKIKDDDREILKLQCNLFKKLFQAKKENNFVPVFDYVQSLLDVINQEIVLVMDSPELEKKSDNYQLKIDVICLHIAILSREFITIEKKDQRLAVINAKIAEYNENVEKTNKQVRQKKLETFDDIPLDDSDQKPRASLINAVKAVMVPVTPQEEVIPKILGSVGFGVDEYGREDKNTILISNIDCEADSLKRAKFKKDLEVLKSAATKTNCAITKIVITKCQDPKGRLLDSISAVLDNVREITIDRSVIGQITDKAGNELRFPRLSALKITYTDFQKGTIKFNAERLKEIKIDQDSRRSLADAKDIVISSQITFEDFRENFGAKYDDSVSTRLSYNKGRWNNMEREILENRLTDETYKTTVPKLQKDFPHDVKDKFLLIEKIVIIGAHIKTIIAFFERKERNKGITKFEEESFKFFQSVLKLLNLFKEKTEVKILDETPNILAAGDDELTKIFDMLKLFIQISTLLNIKDLASYQIFRQAELKIEEFSKSIQIKALGTLKDEVFTIDSIEDLEAFLSVVKDVCTAKKDQGDNRDYEFDYIDFRLTKAFQFVKENKLGSSYPIIKDLHSLNLELKTGNLEPVFTRFKKSLDEINQAVKKHLDDYHPGESEKKMEKLQSEVESVLLNFSILTKYIKAKNREGESISEMEAINEVVVQYREYVCNFDRVKESFEASAFSNISSADVRDSLSPSTSTRALAKQTAPAVLPRTSVAGIK